MEALYWEAVTREMMNVIRTLSKWFEWSDFKDSYIHEMQNDPPSLGVVRKFLDRVSAPGEKRRMVHGE